MPSILEIAKKIRESGGRLYLVGGAVRDEILGKQISDADYCVTGLTGKEFEQLFPETITRGKFFQVYDLYNCEFAMARAEKKKGVGHKEFEITTGKEITIEQDLARRDITINSIAKDVITGEIIDPFNGKKDIENKIIKHTTQAFIEDPLRVYRVARFAATLEFNVYEKTLSLMETIKKELVTLSKERVFVEFKKALSAKKTSIFFNVLRKSNVLDVHFKEISNLIGALQPEKYHPEGDSYNHTMISVDKSSELTDNLEIKYAVLVHDLGKGLTPKEEYPHHYNHDKNGVQPVQDLSNRIGVPTSWRKCGKFSAKEHMRAEIFKQMRTSKQVDLIEKMDKSLLGLEGMGIVVICDGSLKNNITLNDIEFIKYGKEMLREINGEYIKKKYNIEPGLKFKEILREERINWLKQKCK